MASSTGSWQVVGKDGKANKNSAGKKKTKGKSSEGAMPKLDIRPPIPQSESQYAALHKKEKESFVIPNEVYSDDDSDTHVASRHEHKTKKEKKQPKHHKDSHLDANAILMESLKKCDSSSLKEFISQTNRNGLGLLKDLTAFLQGQFKQLGMERDPTLAAYDKGFPLCAIPDDGVEVILLQLEDFTEDEMCRLFWFCLDEFVTEINKGNATYGVRAMIQCIVKSFPRVLIKERDECLSLVISKGENSREKLSLLWVLGQTSNNEDVKERLTVWFNLLLPLIEQKHTSNYIIDHLQLTLRLGKSDKFNEIPLNGKQFQRMMELTHATKYSHIQHQTQLQSLYPVIKAIVFTTRSSESSLSSVFEELLCTLNTELGEKYRREALRCLIECLKKDKTCHLQWRKTYTVHMKESSILLKIIVSNWNSMKLNYEIPQKHLLETLIEFQEINLEQNKRERYKPGLDDCQKSCEELLHMISINPTRMSNHSSSGMTRIFKFLFIIIIICVSVDVFINDGYEYSKTSWVLKQYGIENLLLKTYNYGILYASRINSWLAKHFPYWYKAVSEVVGPTSDYLMKQLGEALLYAHNATAPARQSVLRNLPPLLNKVDRILSNFFHAAFTGLLKIWDYSSPIIIKYTKIAWNALAIWVPRVALRAHDVAFQSGMWFYGLSPDFFDAVRDGLRRLIHEVITTVPHILALVHEYVMMAWALLVANLTKALSWIISRI
ncbi:transmembrane protein 214-B-like [Xenia sp. Carnegie-2017]|uniref:transmembrane protein 214-B-like n=1 Tax=Xenia sp. Carnegie-2017 TaxID=2897299 RepID=UPI001F0470F4|nr:transmembrane protein 214-B-like [Xenia sp. Carnegie-2017]